MREPEFRMIDVQFRAGEYVVEVTASTDNHAVPPMPVEPGVYDCLGVVAARMPGGWSYRAAFLYRGTIEWLVLGEPNLLSTICGVVLRPKRPEDRPIIAGVPSPIDTTKVDERGA